MIFLGISSNKHLLLVAKGVDNPANRIGVAEEGSLRSSVCPAEECPQIRMTMVPAYNDEMILYALIDSSPNLRAHFERDRRIAVHLAGNSIYEDNQRTRRIVRGQVVLPHAA